ncbi:MAG: hypothetical protein Kow00103_03400 [Candidatus Caldatribacteriota bacterium]
MRDKKFVATHRGGLLSREQHIQLMKWAVRCAEHILPFLREKVDERLIKALQIARNWTVGIASVGEARKASVDAHKVARESSDPITIAVARSVGHAVATAHAADHSLGAALYACKALKNAGKNVELEKRWQEEQLTWEIREIVLRGLKEKGIHFKL